MTEQTTTATDLLDFIRIAVRSGNNRKAHEALCDLDSALTSGASLPEQWPQEAELVALRTELAALRKALDDRRTVEGWVAKSPMDRMILVGCIPDGAVAVPTVVLIDTAMHKRWLFLGRTTIDEAFSAAAEWVRRQL